MAEELQPSCLKSKKFQCIFLPFWFIRNACRRSKLETHVDETELILEMDFYIQIRTNVHLNSSDGFLSFLLHASKTGSSRKRGRGNCIASFLTKHYLHFTNIYAHQMIYIPFPILFVLSVHYRKQRDRKYLDKGTM